jgi:hypothetical protein
MTCDCDWAAPCAALRKGRHATAAATGPIPALLCARKGKTCDYDFDWAEFCAAPRKKGSTCDCGCDWAEPCAALRKESVNCDCDWAEPCAALRNKKR